MSAAKKIAQKRKSVRFKPDEGSYAQIDVSNHSKKHFDPTLIGLITDESYRGCGLVVLNTFPLQKNEKLVIKVGKLGPLEGKVIWRKEIEGKAIFIGIEYCD